MRRGAVAALVLSNTAHKIGTAKMWNDRIDSIRSGGLAPLVAPVMERWFTSAFRRRDNPLYLGASTMLERQSAEGYAATCAAIRDADFTAVAAAITVPTLCVAADSDGSTPPDLVGALAALVPASTSVEIANCGHIPCLEQPQAYAAAVRNFLASLAKE